MSKTLWMSYTTGRSRRSKTIPHSPSELEFNGRFEWFRSFGRSEGLECHEMSSRSRRSGKPKRFGRYVMSNMSETIPQGPFLIV